MDNRTKVAAESFIRNLTGAEAAEVQAYFTEVSLNQGFHESFEEKRSASGRRRHSSWDFGIGPTLGVVLYAICRRIKPDIVVETGVASGVSSSYILCALEKNKQGRLYSIDLPWWPEEPSGWMIPDYLRHRWHLIQDKSSRALAPLLKEAGQIDVFLHDSEHSYRNMTWEYQTAWKHLRVGGLLLSHNIDDNSAFPDFCQERGAPGYALTNLGGVVKAGTKM